MFDFAIDFFKHGWNDVFLLHNLNFRSGRPYILQKYRGAVGFVTLKIVGILYEMRFEDLTYQNKDFVFYPAVPSQSRCPRYQR